MKKRISTATAYGRTEKQLQDLHKHKAELQRELKQTEKAIALNEQLLKSLKEG